MFDAMMRLVEQQNSDGAISRPEFDPPRPSGTSPTDEGRDALIAFIDSATPERHKFETADGRKAVVFFDTRGRAASAVLADLDDDTLRWIAQTKDMRGTPLPKSDPGYPQPVQEGVGFNLTPKSRTAIEKLVYAKFPPDSKMKQGGRLKVMFTGDTAKLAGVQSYTNLYLDQVECAKLVDVAKHIAGDAAVERLIEKLAEESDPVLAVDLADLTEAGAPMRTFKLGTFMHLRTQTLDAWFYPLEDQKNGGLAGLQVDIRDSGKPGKPVRKSLPSSHRSGWKEESPPDAVRAKFEDHPEFKKE